MCTLPVRCQPWACIMGRSEGEAKVLSSALGIKTKHKAMLVPSVILCCSPALHICGSAEGQAGGSQREMCTEDQEARVQISRGSLREAACSHHHLSQPLGVSSEDEQTPKCENER